jgi:hypothetical protein
VCVCMRVIVCERQNLILILFDFIKIVAHTQREKTLAKNTHPFCPFSVFLWRGMDGIPFVVCFLDLVTTKLADEKEGGTEKSFHTLIS